MIPSDHSPWSLNKWSQLSQFVSIFSCPNESRPWIAKKPSWVGTPSLCCYFQHLRPNHPGCKRSPISSVSPSACLNSCLQNLAPDLCVGNQPGWTIFSGSCQAKIARFPNIQIWSKLEDIVFMPVSTRRTQLDQISRYGAGDIVKPVCVFYTKTRHNSKV